MFDMRRFLPIQLLVLMAVIAFYTSIAYASSMTPSPRGEGESPIGGWIVSNIQYRFQDGAAPRNVVEFDLDGPAQTVKVSVSSSSSSFSDCLNTSGTHWYCVVGPDVGISEFDQLRVIAN